MTLRFPPPQDASGAVESVQGSLWIWLSVKQLNMEEKMGCQSDLRPPNVHLGGHHGTYPLLRVSLTDHRVGHILIFAKLKQTAKAAASLLIFIPFHIYVRASAPRVLRGRSFTCELAASLNLTFEQAKRIGAFCRSLLFICGKS